ncbi:hypothetical protein ACJIZ3_002049 [Penstemon smallii]|uniref:Homeobox-leucine zipper protein n=1 Tax=Penstemon smallii TaxID=265156 RepID=A0ABD3U6U7_9LAMI
MFRNNEDCHFPLSASCAPQDFQGVSDFLMRRSMSFSGVERAEELQPDDDMSDDGSQMLGEKKRRLNLEQVKALEKSFEKGNKLEPERKMQLARALGLQPRQVAIWFQNRRARWKTKQLEKDYDVLKRQFDALKADNDALKSQNKKLQTQLVVMKSSRESTGGINLNKDNEGSWSNGSENSCDVNLNTTSTTTDSTLLYLNSTHKNGVVFPSTMGGPVAVTQFLSRPDQAPTAAPNEGFCNLFGGIEENQEFWPWAEQQNFH